MKQEKNKLFSLKNRLSVKKLMAFLSLFSLASLKTKVSYAGSEVVICVFGICGSGSSGGGGGECGGDTIGAVICNLIAGTALLPTLLAALSYLFGLFFVTMAIIKLKEHVESPQQVPLSEPVKRMIAGAGFLALPYVTQAAKATLVGDNDTGIDTQSGIVSGDISDGGLDTLLFFFIADIFEPMMFLISSFGYLAGIILVMVGISRMLKSAQEGPKGPGGMGTIFTFLVAGVLFSIDSIMAAATGTFFGNNDIAAGASLLSSTGDADVDDHILAVISSVVGFMIIVGLIAFVRGIFILREVAEGSGQASLMAAMSHIIGGALAVNIGGVANAVQNTFGIGLVGFG